MTIRKQIQVILNNVTQNSNRVDRIESLSDNHALMFSEWLMINCDYRNHCVWEYQGVEYTQLELLNKFKNETRCQ